VAGYKSLFAFWSGGAGSVTPTTTAGKRSMLAPWIGGAAALPASSTAGYRSMLAFWSGGAFGYEAPVNEVIWTQGAHGGGGASNGQPVELHDWRSINDLFKTDKQEAIQAARARQLAEDDIILSAIMSAVTEDLI